MFKTKPTIRYIEPRVFDKETIEKLFDAQGRCIGVMYRELVTEEELKKLYPDADKR